MKNNHISKGPLVIVITIVIIYSILAGIYVASVKTHVNNDTYSYLSEVTKQGVKIVRNQIEAEFQAMKSMARFIESRHILNEDEVINFLSYEVRENSFKRMGIVYASGDATMIDGHSLNLSDREYFKEALEGTTTISNTLEDRIGGDHINAYATPLYKDGSIYAVLLATHSTDVFKELLSVTSFGEEGYSYIIQSDGTSVVDSNHPNSVKNFNNVFDFLDEDFNGCISDKEEFKENLREGRGGNISYTHSGMKKYMSYEPIGIKDWYITTIVPVGVISEKSDYIIGSVFILAVVTILIFAILLFYILIINKKSKKILEKIAFTDTLTGYSNWNKFIIDCETLLKNTNNKYAMILLDVDKFKLINDLFGQERGNNTLKYISQVICNNIGQDETFSRVSNDTFGIFIKYKNEDEIVRRIKRIEENITNYYDHYRILLSFGVYVITDRNIDINIVSDRANLAKRTVKNKTDITYAFYSDIIRDNILREKEIENAMEEALINNEFKVYLQPKYRLKDESLLGAEALVRWVVQEGNIIPPNEFIPIFEKNGFIKRLDMYVFERVCDFLRDLNLKGIEDVPTISINLSRVHLSDVHIAQILGKITKKYNVDAKNIEIELTESAVFNNEKQLISIMRELREVGFKISIDDFGSGYSSLNILKDLPADILKLDKAFLDRASDAKGEKIIENIINMSKDLDLYTVAEGVETLEQVNFLKKIGCDLAQGYYYARPMPMEEFIEYLY